MKNQQGQKVNFKFDFAFPDDAPREYVYDTTSSPIESDVFELLIHI